MCDFCCKFAPKLANCVVNTIKMKRKIAIIAGGDSSEHEVSLRSAAGLYGWISGAGYDVTIVVLKGKEWKAIPHEVMGDATQINDEMLKQACPIDKNDFSFTRGGVKSTYHTCKYIFSGYVFFHIVLFTIKSYCREIILVQNSLLIIIQFTEIYTAFMDKEPQ